MKIHLCLQGLNLLLKLVIPSGSDELDSYFCTPGSNNVLYPLGRHLSHADNAALIPSIQAAAAAEGKAYLRLLKLLTPSLLQETRYHKMRRIARGASAEVSTCAVEW